MAKTSNSAHLGLILLRLVTGLIFALHGCRSSTVALNLPPRVSARWESRHPS